jgi:hypothetical protein
VKVGRGDKYLTIEHNTDYIKVGVMACGDGGGCEGAEVPLRLLACTYHNFQYHFSCTSRLCQYAESGR